MANPLITTIITLCIVGHTLANSPPVANAGLDRTAGKSQEIILQGSAYDPDNEEIVDWLWTVEVSPDGSNPYISDIHRADANFTGDVIGNYVLALKASDGNSWGGVDPILIRITEANCPAGDLTGDCGVDVDDFYMFCNQWLDAEECFGSPGCADLTGDNFVGFADFADLGIGWRLPPFELGFVVSADGDDLLDAYNLLKTSAPATFYLLAGTYQLGTRKLVLDTNDIHLKGIGNVIITKDGGTTVLQTAERLHIDNITIKNTGGYGSSAFELDSTNNDLSDYNNVVLEVSNPSDVNAGVYALYVNRDIKGMWRNCNISNIRKNTWEGVAAPVFTNTTINGLNPDTYSYRKRITLQASPDGALTDYQIKLTINRDDGADSNSSGTIYLANRAANFPYDFGFKDANGTDLNYWICNYDATSVTTYVECNIPEFGTRDIYIHYPNSVPLTRSNGWAAFPKFFDDFSNHNESLGHWINSLMWNNASRIWQGYHLPEDISKYDYIGEMQEGALIFAMELNDHTLDNHIAAHFNWLHTIIQPDGGLPSSANYQSTLGLHISALALGYRWFAGSNAILAEQCYNDMVKVYDYTKTAYPATNDTGFYYSVTLRGIAQAYIAFDANNDATRKADALTWLNAIKDTFLANQHNDGYFIQSDDPAITIQNQMKRAFGLLYAYDCNNDPCIIEAVKRLVDWMIAGRLRPDGGLIWTNGDNQNFFFVHQAWFMTTLKMLMNRSSFDYSNTIASAFGYVTSTNGAGVDMFVDNLERYGNFIPYRYIDEVSDVAMSAIQGQSGSYEIGAGLCALALNYNLVKNCKSAHSDSFFDYLYMLVEACKKSPYELGYMERQRNLPATRWTYGSTVSAPIFWDYTRMAWIQGILGAEASHFNTIKTTSSFGDFGLDLIMALGDTHQWNCQPEIYIRDTNEYTSCYLVTIKGDNDNKIALYKNTTQIKDSNWYMPTLSYINFTILANGENIKDYVGTNRYNDYTDYGTPILMGPIALGNYHRAKSVLYDSIAVRNITANPPDINNIGGEEAL